MRAAISALVALFVLAGAGASARASTPNVVGVLIRPITASCYPDEPCDPPAVAASLAFSRNGSVVARVRVGANGRFALHLAPGVYGVRAAPPALMGKLTPATFRVPRTGTVQLRLRFS
jgi:hypothetical protein